MVWTSVDQEKQVSTATYPTMRPTTPKLVRAPYIARSSEHGSRLFAARKGALISNVPRSDKLWE
ncbi:hypothetical protein CCMA1212_002744 [Trichoderma ghanense]|uniref:Uncharacterized protein n=1 Tax=Trichoderma ghanense TaxID=65468 RepID=A0ABY2HEM2_9HYPO